MGSRVGVHADRENRPWRLRKRDAGAGHIHDAVVVLAVPLCVLDGRLQHCLVEGEDLGLRQRLQAQQPARYRV